MKKPYLISVDILDGEHEYPGHVIFWAKSTKQVKVWVDKNLDSYFSFGDDLATIKFHSIRSISINDARTLEQLQVVYSTNRPKGDNYV
jgi:elongation factor P hydroxylase